jgi:hypothetical protein
MTWAKGVEHEALLQLHVGFTLRPLNPGTFGHSPNLPYSRDCMPKAVLTSAVREWLATLKLDHMLTRRYSVRCRSLFTVTGESDSQKRFRSLLLWVPAN